MATLTELVKEIELTENKEPLNINEDVGKWEKATVKIIERHKNPNPSDLFWITNTPIR